MRKKLYKGISFRNFTKNKTIYMEDLDIIRADIINHIHTLRGEKRKHPRFGTIAGEIKFKPLTPDLETRMGDDIREVIAYDPRVNLLSLKSNIDYERKIIIYDVKVQYVELNITGIIHLNIELGD